MAAEGLHDQHRSIPAEEREFEGTTIYMDYAFLTSPDEPGHLPKVLVLYDDEEDAVWALFVGSNGSSPEVVSRILQKIEEG